MLQCIVLHIQPPLHLCLWLTGQLERPRFYCAAPHISLVALPPGAHPGFDLWSVPPLQKPVIPDMRLSVSFVGLYLACCQLLRVVVVFPITRYFCMFFPIFRYIFHVFVDQTGYLPPLRCLITSSRFCPRFRSSPSSLMNMPIFPILARISAKQWCV